MVTVGGARTVITAAVLETDPDPLEILTVYEPASVERTEEIWYTELVANEMATLLRNHWYWSGGVPDA